jgi:dipeptide/tripeptide permease
MAACLLCLQITSEINGYSLLEDTLLQQPLQHQTLHDFKWEDLLTELKTQLPTLYAAVIASARKPHEKDKITQYVCLICVKVVHFMLYQLYTVCKIHVPIIDVPVKPV